jgi:hypothetical protein
MRRIWEDSEMSDDQGQATPLDFPGLERRGVPRNVRNESERR